MQGCEFPSTSGLLCRDTSAVCRYAEDPQDRWVTESTLELWQETRCIGVVYRMADLGPGFTQVPLLNTLISGKLFNFSKPQFPLL